MCILCCERGSGRFTLVALSLVVSAVVALLLPDCKTMVRFGSTAAFGISGQRTNGVRGRISWLQCKHSKTYEESVVANALSTKASVQGHSDRCAVLLPALPHA